VLLTACAHHPEAAKSPPDAPPLAPKPIAQRPSTGRSFTMAVDDASAMEALSVTEQALGIPVMIRAGALHDLACVTVSVHVAGVTSTVLADRVFEELRAKGFVVRSTANPDGFEVRVDENAPSHCPASPPAQPDPDTVAAEIRPGMKIVSPTESTMTRKAFELLVEQHLVRHVRIVPEQTNGKMTCIRVFGIRRDGIPAALGLENGDCVVSINGTRFESPERLLESYEQLKRAASIELVLQRAGRPVKIIIRLTE
jgi:S1-C subfamily serine protease